MNNLNKEVIARSLKFKKIKNSSNKRKPYLRLMNNLPDKRYNSSRFKWRIGYFPELGKKWLRQRLIKTLF